MPTLEARLRLALTDRLPVLSVSDGMRALLGFAPEDFSSARVSLRDRIHPDDLDIADILFSRDVRQRAGEFNIRLRQANGRIRCVRGSYGKHADAAGDGLILDLLLQDARSLAGSPDEAAHMANFRAMMEITDDYIFFKDRNHVFTGASQSLVTLCDPAEHWTDLIGQTDYDVFPEEYADIYYRLEKQVFAGIPVAQDIQEFQAKDGRKGWVDNRKYPIRDGNGEIVGLYGIARDVTASKLADEALRESEERLRLALDAANQGWFDLDLQTGKATHSPEYPRILGYAPGEFDPSLAGWQDSLHPDDRAAVMAAFQDCLAHGGPTTMEYRRRTREGGWVWLHSIGKIIQWGPGRQPLRMIGIHTDITGRKLMQIELERQARTDYLTGVCNRGHFMERAELELSRAVRYRGELSILVMDIDFFKQINDRHGHKVGDTVLKKLAEVCARTLRAIDIVGRLGGEEFAILLPETSAEAATEAAQRLRQALAAASVALESELPLQFTVSIGVTSLASPDHDMDVLLNLADKALYEAKNSGRNKVCVATA